MGRRTSGGPGLRLGRAGERRVGLESRREGGSVCVGLTSTADTVRSGGGGEAVI